MKTEKSEIIFNHLDEKFKISVCLNSGIIEVRKRIELNWFKSLFCGHGYTWKRIYFGHILPLEEFVKFYNKVLDDKK